MRACGVTNGDAASPCGDDVPAGVLGDGGSGALNGITAVALGDIDEVDGGGFGGFFDESAPPIVRFFHLTGGAKVPSTQGHSAHGN